MCAENYPGPNLRGFSYTTVANSAVFHECAKLVDQQTPNREGDIPELSSSIADQPTPATSTIRLTGMQIIRHSLSECQVPPDIADVIMQSWRTSTQKQYQVYINQWVQFCLQDPLCPTVTAVLDFLHSLFKQGLSYSTLNTARSAISNVEIQSNNVHGHTPVGRHMLVCRYLKGVFNMRKPTPKYSNIWTVDIILDYLSSLWPLNQLTLKQT